MFSVQVATVGTGAAVGAVRPEGEVLLKTENNRSMVRELVTCVAFDCASTEHF